MKNLEKHSKYVRIIGQITFWMVIIAALAAVIVIWVAPSGGLKLKIDDNQFLLENAAIKHKILASLIVLVAIFVIAYGIHHFHRLFSLYEKGEIFGRENVKHFKALGLAFVFWFCAQFLILLISTQLSDIATEPIDLDLEFSTLIIGIAIILISRVMDEGRKLQEEQELTI